MRPEGVSVDYVFYFPADQQNPARYNYHDGYYHNLDELPPYIAERVAILDTTDFKYAVPGVGIKSRSMINYVEYMIWVNKGELW